jgi:hypothetical protein
MFFKDRLGIREIARIMEGRCSRRTIQYILYPERLAVVKAQFKERRKDGRYYNKDKHREAIKNTRHYKQKLKLEGKLISK